MAKPAQAQQSDVGNIRALIIGGIGLAGLIVLGFLVPEVLFWDLILLFVVVIFVALGSKQNIIQGLATSVMLYIALGIAATFYYFLTPYSRSFLNILDFVGINTMPGGEVDYNALVFSFILIWIVVWAPLEALSRSLFPDTRLSKLGFLDTLGGMLIYLGIGLVVAAMLFNLLGYSLAGRFAYSNAHFGPMFKRIFRLYYATQSFWFFGRPPAIYAYNL